MGVYINIVIYIYIFSVSSGWCHSEKSGIVFLFVVSSTLALIIVWPLSICSGYIYEQRHECNSEIAID